MRRPPFYLYVLRYFKSIPSAWLLLVQLLILIALPVLSDSFEGQLVSWILSMIALMMVALIIRNSPVFTAVGLALVVSALSVSAWAFFTQRSELYAIAHILEAAAYFYAAAGMVMYMFADDIVTRDELFAVAAVPANEQV